METCKIDQQIDMRSQWVRNGCMPDSDTLSHWVGSFSAKANLVLVPCSLFLLLNVILSQKMIEQIQVFFLFLVGIPWAREIEAPTAPWANPRYVPERHSFYYQARISGVIPLTRAVLPRVLP